MAFFAQGDYETPGMQQFAQFATGGAPQEDDLTKWDNWMAHFQPPVPNPDLVPPGLQGPMQGLAELQQTGQYASALYQQRQDRKRLVELARKAGVNPDDPIALGELWANAVKAAQATSVVEPDIDPWAILEGWADEGAPGTLKREESERQRREQFFEEEPPDPYTITRTDEQVQLTDPETARALITRMLTDQLGRAPDESEIRDFTAALNAHERANPTVTTTVEEYAYDVDSGAVQLQDRDVTTEGGAGAPTAFAENMIGEEHEPERDAYTAGTQYFNVMEALTGSL